MGVDRPLGGRCSYFCKYSSKTLQMQLWRSGGVFTPPPSLSLSLTLTHCCCFFFLERDKLSFMWDAVAVVFFVSFRQPPTLLCGLDSPRSARCLSDFPPDRVNPPLCCLVLCVSVVVTTVQLPPHPPLFYFHLGPSSNHSV